MNVSLKNPLCLHMNCVESFLIFLQHKSTQNQKPAVEFWLRGGFSVSLLFKETFRFFEFKALAIGAGVCGRIRLVCADSDRFKRAVVFAAVVVFAVCHVADYALVCVVVVDH